MRHSLFHTNRDATAGGLSSYPVITLTVTVAADAPASVINTASVSGGGETNTSNNTASDPTTIDSPATGPDLSIAKSDAGTFTPRQAGASYTLVVTNGGGAPTAGTVTVTDTLPVGLTATAMSGDGWSCVLATLTCTRSDALGVGSRYPAITLTVSVAPSAAGSLVNTATVAGGGDVSPSNNTATDVTAIASVAPIPALSPVGPALLVLAVILPAVILLRRRAAAEASQRPRISSPTGARPARGRRRGSI
jgi:hypothetical protein